MTIKLKKSFDVNVIGRDMDKLRVVIVLDRCRGTAFAAVLNEENHRWASITDGEHTLIDANDYDGCFDAINDCCNDILRWAESNDAETPTP